MTTARYYTPSGRSIQAVGIEPDIVVELAKIESLARPDATREADLRGALENGNTQEEKDKVENQPAEEKPRDYQLDRALDLIRGVALFREKVVMTK